MVPLGKLGDWGGGGTPSKSKPAFWTDGTVPWVSPKDMKFDVIENSQDLITQNAVENSSAKLYPTGTVLLVTRSAILLHSLPVAKTVKEVTVNQDLKALIPADCMNVDYIVAALRASASRILNECRKAGTTVCSIDFSKLKAYEIPVAPLNEQRRIVAKIEELTARSRNAKQALDAIPPLLERFRQSVLAAAFRGDLTKQWRQQNPNTEPASELLKRIRQERRHRWEQDYLQTQKAKGTPPKNDKWKAEYTEWQPQGNRSSVAAQGIREVRKEHFPETWEVCFLGEVAELQPGYAFKSKWYRSEGLRLLRGTNIIPGGTRWEETVCIEPERESEFVDYQLNPEDIVIAMDRPLISSGLKVAQLEEADLPALLLQRVGRFHRSRYLKPAFVFWYLNSVRFMNHIGVQATGTQLPHISKSDIETAPIPLPPLDEQKAIVDCLEQVFSSHRAIEQACTGMRDRIARLNQSILAKAFRGELVPQDPNDEPAAALLERIRSDSKTRK